MYTEEQLQAIKQVEKEMKGKYLTETSLGDILKVLYPNNTWEHDKKFETATRKFRPDYCCHELKMCVEFDGADHYMKANVIRADVAKDNFLKEAGYKVIRIPYFIQLTTETIKLLFDIKVEFDYGYKHGFINRNATLPASFCELGVWKFKNDLCRFNYKSEVNEQIKESISDKIEALAMPKEMAKLYVAPSTLFLDLGIADVDHESERNQMIINNNLQDNWNCVILEASQTILNIDGVHDMQYDYDEEGDLTGFTFKMYTDVYEFYIHPEEGSKRSLATYGVYKNNKYISNSKCLSKTIDVFNLTKDILYKSKD